MLTKESRNKTGGGGLAVFLNDKCPELHHLTIKKTLCSKDIELVS